MKINQILPQEHKFTEVLTSIAVVPKMLFYYGKLPENSASIPNTAPSIKARFSLKNAQSAIRPKTVAIVGARRNTAYGENVAYKIAYELAKCGIVIVSGLAIGIDSIAHKGALAAGGRTVGVLGTAINKIYPARNIGLAREIIHANGCIISEYGPDTITYRTSFLERNRLIAGLSDAVVIAEATDHSGSLNTAMHALEQGKDVFAVPADITKLTSLGCNRLIMQGAMPYTCVEDILHVLFPQRKCESKKGRLPFGDNGDETAVLQAIAKGESDGEKIAEKLAITPAKYGQIITMLEIKGRVRNLGANKWILCS